MSLRSITVHLDERWYDALARQAAKQDMTVEEEPSPEVGLTL